MTEPIATSGVPAAAPTSYIVLRLKGDAWAFVDGVSARDSNAAIKAAVTALPADQQTGKFVAIPARSFQPVSVAPKVTTTLELEEAPL